MKKHTKIAMLLGVLIITGAAGTAIEYCTGCFRSCGTDPQKNSLFPGCHSRRKPYLTDNLRKGLLNKINKTKSCRSQALDTSKADSQLTAKVRIQWETLDFFFVIADDQIGKNTDSQMAGNHGNDYMVIFGGKMDFGIDSGT